MGAGVCGQYRQCAFSGEKSASAAAGTTDSLRDGAALRNDKSSGILGILGAARN
jgi:hypothetical protein